MSRIQLCKPVAGKAAQCSVQHGHVYVLDFDTSNATFSRQNGDLSILFEDASRLVLRHFYSETELGDIFLELPDGATVSARDVIEAMNLSPEDFVTGNESVLSAGAHASEYVFASEAHAYTGESASGEQGILLSGIMLFPELSGQDTVHPANIAGSSAAFADMEDILLSPAGEGVADARGYGLFQIADAENVAAADKGQDGEALLTPGQSEGGLFGNPFLNLAGETRQTELARSLLAEEASTSPQASANAEGAAPFHADLAAPAGNDGIRSDASELILFSLAGGKDSELLLLEDLLDTTIPSLTAGTESAPAFEELFLPSPEEGFHARVDNYSSSMDLDTSHAIAAADAMDDSSDQVLLAFLRMGSL